MAKKFVEDAVIGNVLEWNGVQISVKESLRLDEMLGFMKQYAARCFSEDGEYLPEMRIAAFRITTLEYFTDAVLPEDIHQAFDLAMMTDLYESVTAKINPDYFTFICDAASEKVEYLADLNADALRRKVDEAVTAVTELVGKIGDLFADVEKEDMKTLASAMATGKLDEGKMIKAYMKEQAKKK